MIDLKIDQNTLEICCKNGFSKTVSLREGQLEAINSIKDNFMENFLFFAPTAYGKTIVAVYYIYRIYQEGMKVLYTTPLKALTSEVVEDLTAMGLKVIEDTGEYRKKVDKDYANADVVCTTYERLDAIMRNPKNHEYLDDFGLLVVDEIHSIHSESRGVNLESLIVKTKFHTGLTIMGMSATADNYEELANFLNCNYVYVPAEKRPVKQDIKILYYGGTYQTETMSNRNKILSPILKDLIARDKQALVFCSSRKRCEQLAKHFSGSYEKDPIILAKKTNYTYHHAGVQAISKKKIENMFREGKVKVIFSTPTLAIGVNLPAYSVIIYDTERWNGLKSENELIESMEVEQMTGRAGRPQFGETTCEVYIFANECWKPYEFEEKIVKSRLCENMKATMNEWITSDINHVDDILNALNSSLLKIQLNQEKMMDKARESFDYLIKNSFVKMEETTYIPTFLGRMTALFYINPETALHFKKVERQYNSKMSDIELISRLLNTEEFLDNIRVDDEIDKELMNVSERIFRDNEIAGNLWNKKIMKVVPMLFSRYVEEKYGKRIIIYRTAITQLSTLMERLLSSAEVISFANKEMKKRISDLKIMIKNKTLDRSIAILKNTKGLGDTRLNKLINANIKTPEAFLRKSMEYMTKLLRISETTYNTMKKDLKIQMKAMEASH